MKAMLLAGLFVAATIVSAQAQDDVPMNTSELDPAMLDDFYGAWEITDESGSKRCRVELRAAATIGGNEIEVDPGCVKAFKVMEDITAWRLMEGWVIQLADATRKTRVRFFTPDERYIAEPTEDGIFTIEQLPK
ncbi:MAG: AprI/Inh family metalloprotease inhibitor [Rhizobiaceae bacterium]